MTTDGTDWIGTGDLDDALVRLRWVHTMMGAAEGYATVEDMVMDYGNDWHADDEGSGTGKPELDELIRVALARIPADMVLDHMDDPN